MGPRLHCKVLRMVALIRFLEAGGETSAAELAERAGVNVRTASRMLLDAQEFVPLVEPARGRYRAMPEEGKSWSR